MQPPLDFTWDAIRAYIGANYRIARESAGSLVLAWTFPRADGRSSYQEVTVTPARAFGESWVRIVAAIGPRTLIDPTWALEHNGTLAVGHVMFLDANAVIALQLPAVGIAVEDLARALEAIPHEAARIREGGAEAENDAPMFSDYAH